MTQSVTARNLALAFDVVRHALQDEKTAEGLAELGREGILVVYNSEDPELTAANDQIADSIRSNGEPLVQLEMEHRLTFQHR